MYVRNLQKANKEKNKHINLYRKKIETKIYKMKRVKYKV